MPPNRPSHAAPLTPLSSCVQKQLGGNQPHEFQVHAAAAMLKGVDVFVARKAGEGKTDALVGALLVAPKRHPGARGPLAPQLGRMRSVLVVFSPLISLAREQEYRLNASAESPKLVQRANGETDTVAFAYAVGGSRESDYVGSEDAREPAGYDELVSHMRQADEDFDSPHSSAANLYARSQLRTPGNEPAAMVILASPEKLRRCREFRRLLARP